jgi:hypothetical protein
MASRLFLLCLFLAASVVPAQLPPGHPREHEERDVKLPGGKSQKDEIVKDDYKRNLEDAARLVKLSEELKVELEKNEKYVVSVANIDRLEEIEKLSKRMRNRLKRY